MRSSSGRPYEDQNEQYHRHCSAALYGSHVVSLLCYAHTLRAYLHVHGVSESEKLPAVCHKCYKLV